MCCSLSGRFAYNIAYGYNAESEKDKMIELANLAVDELSISALPGQHLVDLFNWCKLWLYG
jgi:hypothetical protein